MDNKNLPPPLSESGENVRVPDPFGLPPDLTTIGGPANSGSDSVVEGSPHELASVRTVRSSSPIPEIEGYRIQRKLGQGGMGSVFLAVDENLRREVAIKIVSHTFQESTGLHERFEAEIQALASLQHTNIAQLHSAGKCQGIPYFVMEYVNGPNLDAHAQEPMKPLEAARIVVQLCDAVEYCHNKGVLHRDLKPSNVLLTHNLQPKIADFGLAKSLGSDSSTTKTGEILGTPGYMAPEQAMGVAKKIGKECDVYALGAILYRLITGRAPFVAAEPLQAVMMVLSSDPISPRKLVNGIPADLETILFKCLEKKPGRRYESAALLQDDLQRLIDNRPIRARPNSVFEKAYKWTRRNPTAAAFIGLIMLAVIGGVLALSWHNSVLADQLARSKRLANEGSELSRWIVQNHMSQLEEIMGTTTARHAMVERVTQFLDASFEDMPADPIYTQRMGATYAKLAEIVGGTGRSTLGDIKQAEQNYIKAIELYDRLIVNDPQNLQLIKLKISSLLELTSVQRELQLSDTADTTFTTAQRILDELQTDSDPDLEFLRAQIMNHLIEGQMGENDFESALTTLNKLETFLNSQNETTFNPIELANQRIWLMANRGKCLENVGKLSEALDALTAMTKLAEEGALEFPENPVYVKRYGTALVQLADAQVVNSLVDDAMKNYERALELVTEIAKKDPDNTSAKIDQAIKLSRISDMHLYNERYAAAEKTLLQAIQIHRDLEAKGKGSLTVKQGLCIYIQSLANLYSLQSKFDLAVKSFDEHRQACLEILEQNPNSTSELNQLAEASYYKGLMLLNRFTQIEINPFGIKRNPDYLQIHECLDTSQAYFKQLEELGKLNFHQESMREKISEARELLEAMIKQLQGAEGDSIF